MQIKTMDIDEIREIYYTNMVHEFPPEELKPFSAIDRLLQRDMYLCFGLYDGDTLQGYAFLVTEPGNARLLLDYYVVLEEYRDRGMGTRFMTLLREACATYAAILVEVENPDYAENDEQLTAQKRRVSFYERNGFMDTGIRANLFDAEYRVLQRNIGEHVDGDTFQALDSLYRAMLGDQYGSRLRYHDQEEAHGA